MTERFIFKGEKKTVTGIDENGYGPVVGPLVITGISLVLPFDSIYSVSRDILGFHRAIDDSKKVFKRSLKSYIKGEQIALSILAKAGLSPRSFHSLLKLISTATHYDIPDFPLPVWADTYTTSFNSILDRNIAVDKIHLEIFEADKFNQMVERFRNKAFIDFFGFKLVREATGADVFMMGKIGGTKYYREFFRLTGEYPHTIVETHEVSYYITNQTEIFFLLNGDELYLPLMLASIIGKYVRELYMKAICEKFGLSGEIPYASGYKHDKKTDSLLERIRQSNLSSRFIRVR